MATALAHARAEQAGKSRFFREMMAADMAEIIPERIFYPKFAIKKP